MFALLLSCFSLVLSAENEDTAYVSDEGRLPFEDVKDSYWFTPYIELCYVNGIIKGMTEYTVEPNGTLNRAQFVTMLANLEGVDTGSYTVDNFTDVKSSHWYYGAVAWAYSEGIVSGISGDTFAPSKILTRAELATVMNNYMKDKYTVELKESVLDSFTDKPKEEYWYYDAMVFAVSAGLLSGNSDGTLASTGKVTRAQAAVIFSSFMDRYFYIDCEHSFSEATCTESAVCGECGFVNGLPNGHRLSVYDCNTPGYCLVCGSAVAASDLTHQFANATCTAPRTCSICGDTRGQSLGHKWNAAGCTVAKTCSVCGETEGEALGHTTDNGECERCGKGLFPTNHARICYYVQKKGVEVGSFYKYTTNVTTDNGKKMTVEIFYDPPEPVMGPFPPGEGSLTLRTQYYLNEANWIQTRIDLRREQSTGEKYHSCTVMYYTYEFADAYVRGELRADNMTKDYIQMSFQSGWSSLETDEALYYTVKYFDYALRHLCGSDANEYHFYNIDG